MPLATFTFGDALLEALEIALLVLWIWVAISVVVDIFRSHDLSGGWKAAWVLVIIIMPFLGVLIYLLFRGRDMHERAANAAKAQNDAFRQHVRAVAASPAATSPADDIAKLEDLRSRDVISEEEFQRAKAKTLA
jgi:uncharacterized membrane protein YcjF (UPF0283 family)